MKGKRSKTASLKGRSSAAAAHPRPTDELADTARQVAAISLENNHLHKELEERDARIRHLVDANIIGVIIWDVEGRIIDCNDAFLQIVGYERDDITTGSLRWTELTPVEWRGADEQAVADIRATGTCRAYEKVYIRKDGRCVPVLVAGAAFDGAGQQGVAFAIDLTDRKRTEEAARESDRRCHELQMALAHANRVATAGQLSASIVHEISQPLSGIIANAAMCQRALGKDPLNVAAVRETVERVIKDANRAGQIIWRLRALFSTRKISTEAVNLNEASQEVISLFIEELQSNRVTLQSDFAEDLPSVQGDRIELQQVLMNLIRNAADAMSTVDDRPRHLIIKTAKMARDGVLVAVQDSGPGIEPASRERVFDAFYTTKANGLGMGLSVCRTIIEAHGGKLWATAAATQGAIFQFTLPTCRESGAYTS